jgi:hypothetical protein
MGRTSGSYRSVAWTAAVWFLSVAVGNAQTAISRVSSDAAGGQVAGESRQPTVTEDGRFVAFASTAATLVANDANPRPMSSSRTVRPEPCRA